MKLLIYYSLTGNGDLVAGYLQNRGFQVRKVIEKKKMPKKLFPLMMSGGFRASLNLKGKLIDYDNNVEGFDEIYIGSPIWNGRFPPAINSVLAETDLKGKKLTFILYSGSGDGPKAVKRIKKLYPKARIIRLQEPKKYQFEYDKIANI